MTEYCNFYSIVNFCKPFWRVPFSQAGQLFLVNLFSKLKMQSLVSCAAGFRGLDDAQVLHFFDKVEEHEAEA